MTTIQVCVGSSCCLRGSQEIVEILQQLVAENHLEKQVVLSGSFCTGKCNRVGVTVTVENEVFTGITPVTLREFWKEEIEKRIERG